jgi:hypothetical protein
MGGTADSRLIRMGAFKPTDGLEKIEPVNCPLQIVQQRQRRCR